MSAPRIVARTWLDGNDMGNDLKYSYLVSPSQIDMSLVDSLNVVVFVVFICSWVNNLGSCVFGGLRDVRLEHLIT